MKEGVRGVLIMAAFVAIASCKKDDVDNKDCQSCSGPNVETFDVCEEDGKIFVDGKEIQEGEGLSLEDAARGLEQNPNDEKLFENLSCR